MKLFHPLISLGGEFGTPIAGLLYPGFGAQRQINRHGVCAIHQPESGNELKQSYDAETTVPGQ
jgi:hypothetical protein